MDRATRLPEAPKTVNRLVLYALAAGFALLASPAWVGAQPAVNRGDLTIPADRLPGWYPIQNPVDTTGWTVINVVTLGANPADGANGSDQAALMSAINQANGTTSPRVIYFPAGTYNLTGIPISRSNIALVGDGRTSTILEFSGTSSSAQFGGQYGCPNNQWILVCGTNMPSNATNITSGGTKGSRTVSVGSTSGHAVGNYIELSSQWPASVNTSGFQQGPDMIYSYVAKITGISGAQITFDRPLREDLAGNPTLKKVNALTNVAITGMRIDHASAPTAGSLTFLQTRWLADSSFTDLTIGRCWQNAVSVLYTVRSLFRGNIFLDQVKNAQFDKRTLVLNGSAYENVIENNAFQDDEVGIEIQQGASWNVVAYNYMTWVTTIIAQFGQPRCDRGIFFHGGYPRGNLIEGNDVVCKIEQDQIWGRQGPYNTFFRNRTRDSANGLGDHFSIEYWNAGIPASPYSSYLANATGELGSGDIDAGSDYTWIERNVVRQRINLVTPEPHTVSVNNVIGTAAPANWSTVAIPASFYLSGRPSFWGATRPWPGIGVPQDNFSGTLTRLPAQDLLEGGAPVAPPQPPVLIP